MIPNLRFQSMPRISHEVPSCTNMKNTYQCQIIDSESTADLVFNSVRSNSEMTKSKPKPSESLICFQHFKMPNFSVHSKPSQPLCEYSTCLSGGSSSGLGSNMGQYCNALAPREAQNSLHWQQPASGSLTLSTFFPLLVKKQQLSFSFPLTFYNLHFELGSPNQGPPKNV